MAIARNLHVTDVLTEIQNRGVMDVVASMSHEECVRTTIRYGTHNYHPIEITIVKGEGAWVEDAKGHRYIDCVGCYSALALGHLPARVLQVLKAQTAQLILTSRAVYTRELAIFLKVLCEYTGTDMACPMNTGAEAVETAIKLVRKWAYAVKRVPADKAEIIAAQDNFHGRTTTIVGFSSERSYREFFVPYSPGFNVVPFCDLYAIKRAITPNTAAVLIEPIQAEAGNLLTPKRIFSRPLKGCTKYSS